MPFKNCLRENIILPVSDLLSRQQVSRYLHLLSEAELWDRERMRSFQKARLREVLLFASQKVPYYREWFDSNGLNPRGVSLSQLPIVSKGVMRQEGIGRFASEGFPVKQRLVSRTSGSSGEPFTYYESKLSYSVNMAAKLRTWYQAGYRLGDCYMKIANGDRNGRWKRIRDRINNCLYIPFFHMGDGVMESVLQAIEKEKPAFIRSYPGPLFLLAKYRLAHPGYTFTPRVVFTTGSTLYESYRETIERAFGCDVIDSYSCEGTPNVYETPVHSGYRVTDYYGIIEVLDEQDRPVTDGVGRVVSTDLWNYAHPFIRYDTHDLVEVRCGQIINVIGRNSDVFDCGNGTFFTVHNFSRYFLSETQAVDAYQIVRHQNQSVTFRLVVNSQFTEDTGKAIVDFWRQQLGMPVDLEIVGEIPLMNNNKRPVIINETTE